MKQTLVFAAVFISLIAALVAGIPSKVHSQLPFTPSPSESIADNNTSSANNQSSTTKPSQQHGMLIFTDPEGRFTINYPSNWEVKPPDPLRIATNKIVEFVLSSNKPTITGMPGRDATLSISIENTSKYLDTNSLQVKTHPLHDYVNGKTNVINSLAFGGSSDITLKYLKDASTKVAGLPAWTVSYTSAFGGIPTLYETTTYMVKDDKLYTFDYSSDQLKVPETLPTVQKMIDSFKLMK